jgi:hypothetical protein
MGRLRFCEAQHLALKTLLVTASMAMLGCGGGGGGGGIGPPPQPDFKLTVSPTSQSVNAGDSASVSLSATPENGFSSQVSVQVTGVPTGVSVSPSPITLTPGTPQQVTFTAAQDAAFTTSNVTFTGSSGSLHHTSTLVLTVNGSGNGLPVRARYVRTDATTEYSGWVNQYWILYHAATKRYFVSDTSSNQVIVIDSASQSVTGKIGVPGAFGIDDSADHSTLYVGTQIGDVYAIDPVNMKVIHRYLASEIGPYGYLASVALGLSDGRVALIGPYNGIDGTTSIAVWNPVDNSITIYGGFDPGAQPLPCGSVNGNIGGFARTVDRTQILIGGINGGLFCAINPATGTGNYASAFASTLYIVTTPDGKYILLPNQTGVTLYDPKTLAIVRQFDTKGGLFEVSADSSTLYVLADTVIYAYNIATGNQVGWVPNLFVVPTSGGFVFGALDGPFLQATDGSGLFAGPMEEGVGFIDLSSVHAGAVGTQFTNGYLNPATGPTGGGTATQWSDPNPIGTIKSVFFGGKQAANVSVSSGYINATSPPGNAGPADVYTFTNDGGMQLLPEAFSYGPTILEVTPNMATAEGGGVGLIYGYGFGPTSSNSIPPGLAVTVNGIAAQIVGFAGNAYGVIAPPYPLEVIAYTIPPGVSGSSVDVVVSTNTGSATSSAALTYLPATQQFSLPGSTLVQGIYDPYTDLYYFTDTKQLQVFSRTQGKWMAPIPIPAPKGIAERLWGLALSPDGTKMAVADAGGEIYLLNPANPKSIASFYVGSEPGGAPDPCGVAVSDSGMVYYVTIGAGIGGGHQFYKLDTNTGQIKDYEIEGSDFNGDAYLRNAISTDNARVYNNDDGAPFYIDTATDDVFFALDGYGCCYGNEELTLSNNQTQFSATFYIYDSDLNGESYYTMNDRELLNLLYVYGAKLSPDGRLLFQPSTQGIDVFDGNLGNLQDRVSLPVQLSPNYDALVADGADNILVAITNTGDGIAVVDLTGIPEPSKFMFVPSSLVFEKSRLRFVTKPPLHRASNTVSAARAIRHTKRQLVQLP